MRVTGGEYWAKKPPKMEKVDGIPPEGYELSIRPDGMTIRYSDDAGAYYAKMTLFHMERWNSYTTARVIVPGSAPKEYVSGDYTVVVAPRR
jgi:N-acetyl-beta-hexosaminidase